ncbi:MAG: ATP-binding cassette domain-containing protein [Planctomycetota bacterium]|nr:MAG: ATP-binding cassette domain-containing protein [Planctomycetota bacterium]
MRLAVEIRDLEVRRGPATICRIAQLEVAAGERLAVVGANGSGKTTLLRVVAGLETKFAGEVRPTPSVGAGLYVHQSPYLFRGTVLSNTAYGLAARGMDRSRLREVALRWLQRLGVEHLADRRASSLSGGEQRRVALARAMAVEPSLLLLDEPLAELDDDAIASFRRAVAELPATTVMIASPVSLPDRLATRTFELESPAPTATTA